MCRKTSNLSRSRLFKCPDCRMEFRAQLVRHLSCEHVHVYEGDCRECESRIAYVNGPSRAEVLALRKIVTHEYQRFDVAARVKTWDPFVLLRFLDIPAEAFPH